MRSLSSGGTEGPRSPFRRGKTPNKSRFRKIFRRMDIPAFEHAIRVWLPARGVDGERVALEGKTLRGSADGDVPGRQLLSVFVTDRAAVLGQSQVASTTNEHEPSGCSACRP